MQRFNDWADQIPWMGVARRAEDFRTAHAEGKYATYGNAQPTLDGLSRDLALYDEAFELGCRAIMLTYNNQDFVGTGCTERTNAGFSNFGKRLLKKLNDIGMLVDTSHCGRQDGRRRRRLRAAVFPRPTPRESDL